MKIKFLTAAIATAIGLTSCNNDTENIVTPIAPKTTTFKLTLKNAINYLAVKKIGDAPLKETGQEYVVKFKATKGTYVSFANMFAQSNDWFFATKPSGIKLWDGDIAKTGDISNYINVWDAGTEEDEEFLTDFPNTKYTAPKQESANSGPADDNTTVRNTGRNIKNYLTAYLAYNKDTKYFTLTIKKANRESVHNPGFITPGLLVVHTQPNALFEEGQPAKQNGLESLAEDGSPMALYNWFTEKGSTGAPLRLSSSYSVFSGGVVYTHNGNQSPLFTKGKAAKTNSGLKELAEDGNATIAYNYLKGMENVNVQKSEGPILPGESKTILIEALPGQKLNFATMFVASNDWFISNNQAGIELFDANNYPKDSFTINKNYLYDAGTEEDQTVGLGSGQPMNGNATVAADADTSVRRVSKINDVQFGKGETKSDAGVTQNNDSRGGYNFIEVNVEVMK